MGFRLHGIVHFKKNQAPLKALDVPKGYFAVYVGDNQNKRFVKPLSYLNQPLFQDLLSRAEEEFGYDHPMGAMLSQFPAAKIPSLMSFLVLVHE
ncbi:unnamed protein product [Prunus armeniaca]|nr:hypothetical protein GBA52_026906 [Prunus armeniaca]